MYDYSLINYVHSPENKQQLGTYNSQNILLYTPVVFSLFTLRTLFKFKIVFCGICGIVKNTLVFY